MRKKYYYALKKIVLLLKLKRGDFRRSAARPNRQSNRITAAVLARRRRRKGDLRKRCQIAAVVFLNRNVETAPTSIMPLHTTISHSQPMLSIASENSRLPNAEKT